MGLLPLTVRRRDFEPASGIIRRLAVRAGYGCPTRFLHSVKYCPTSVLGHFDRGQSLDILGRMSGFGASWITASTLVSASDGTYLNGVKVTQTDRSLNGIVPSRGRICQLCLIEDRDCLAGPDECRAFRRVWWDLREFEGCPKHRIPLLNQCPKCERPLLPYLVRPDMCSCGYDLTKAIKGETVSDSAEYELLLMALGSAPPVWATGLSLRAAASIALRIGAMHFFGPHLKELRSFSASERMELLAEGWSILKGGLEAFRTELSASAELGNPKSLNQTYGEIYRWLSRTQETGVGEFRQILFDHAKDTIVSNADITLFERVIPARTKPILGHQVKDAGDSDLTRGIGGNAEMKLALNLNKNQFVRYLQAIDCDRLPSTRNRPKFDVFGLKEFLQRVEIGLPCRRFAPLGEVQAMKCGLLACVWPIAVREVRMGRLVLSGILPSQKGLYRWLVNLDQLRDLVRTDIAEQSALTFSEASERLGIPGATVTKLRRLGILSYEPLVGPAGRKTVGPSLVAIEQFERNFITIRECAKRLQSNVRRVKSDLDELGVESITPASRDIVAIYHRDEVEAALIEA